MTLNRAKSRELFFSEINALIWLTINERCCWQKGSNSKRGQWIEGKTKPPLSYHPCTYA